MLKLIGAGLVIGGCFAMGMCTVKQMSNRIRQLQEIQKILGILESEISYANGTLSECFRHVSERTLPPFQDFFQKTADHMEEYRGEPLREIVKEHIKNDLKKADLLKEDIRQLEDFGKQLGYLDRKRQISAIHLYQSRLEETCAEAGKEYHKKAKLCRYMGITTGLFLVIIFI